MAFRMGAGVSRAAGPRGSKEPEVAAFIRVVVDKAGAAA
jgi:hypothetical protein